MLRSVSAASGRSRRAAGLFISGLRGVSAVVLEHAFGGALGTRWPYLDTISNIALGAVGIVVAGTASMPRYRSNAFARIGRWAGLAAILFAAGWLLPRTRFAFGADLSLTCWLVAALCAWRAYRLGRGATAYATTTARSDL